MNRAHAALLHTDEPDQTGPLVHIQLLHVPDCPRVEQVRATLRRSLSKANVRATIEQVKGQHPSPTLLIGGIDVTGRTHAAGPSCRLDLPTEDQILAALTAASIPKQAP
ncbi:MAG: alkylmercury lyase [Solirubrobacteraceae bacterium]